MIVTITYSPPPRELPPPGPPVRRNDRSPSTVHERRLERVPESTAQQMADDFVLYRLSEQALAPEAEQYKIYRYSEEGREVQIALDFGEILALDVGEESKESTDSDSTTQLQLSRERRRSNGRQ